MGDGTLTTLAVVLLGLTAVLLSRGQAPTLVSILLRVLGVLASLLLGVGAWHAWAEPPGSPMWTIIYGVPAVALLVRCLMPRKQPADSTAS